VQRKIAPARGLRTTRHVCRGLGGALFSLACALPGCGDGEAAVLSTAVAAKELAAPSPVLPGKPAGVPFPAVEPRAAKAKTAPRVDKTSQVVGSIERPAATEDDAPRLYAKTRFVWIRERPDWGAGWLGYLWHGGSAKLKTGKPVFAKGCQVWYEIEPRGYVCVDGRRATLDASDPGYREVLRHVGDYQSATPHRYAMSLGAERYAVLPSAEDQRQREGDYTFHLREIEAVRGGAPARGLLAGVDLTPAPEDAVAFATLPVDVQMYKVALKRDSAMAYFSEYRHGNRTFLLTADLAWVP
jgi:hypothetical protein